MTRTHSTDVRDIEAARRNIGRHQHSRVTLGELVQVLQALPLLQAGVERAGGDVQQLRTQR